MDVTRFQPYQVLLEANELESEVITCCKMQRNLKQVLQPKDFEKLADFVRRLEIKIGTGFMKEGEKMAQTIKLTKRLILYAGLSLIAMILVNVNMEESIFFVDQAWISNDMIMNIVGGLLVGFVAVILEKVYKFKLDKAQALRNLSVYLMLLYGELYYWICNIEELEKDRKLEIPKNLFSGKKPIIESYLWNISRVDYCDFWRKGGMQEKFEMFAKDGIDEIRALQSKMFYLEIALNEKEINVCKNIPYTGDEYKVLHIISDWLQQACDDIEPVLQQIEKEEKNFDWKCQKEKIVENYTGLFTEDLKEFIKNEQNTTTQVDKDDTQGDCHHENSKKDWKLFREKLSDWQEKYMEGLVKEYVNFLNDETKHASEKFWSLEKRIKEDKHHPGVIMEMSKSDAIWDIVALIRRKVITCDDLSDFSDDLQQEVKRILEISR